MTNRNLTEALLLMVKEHGLEQVQRQLDELRTLEQSRDEANVEFPPLATNPPRKRRPKLTATRHVTNLKLTAEKEGPIAELAKRFDSKSFLPAFGDIRHFCDIYGVDTPASRTRISAIPRVFKRIATLEAADIQRIIDEGHFSGPSRLGPIADAIRRNGRVAAAEDATRNNST